MKEKLKEKMKGASPWMKSLIIIGAILSMLATIEIDGLDSESKKLIGFVSSTINVIISATNE